MGNIGCYHGWSITKQTMKSDMYKQCRKEALKEYEHFIRDFDEKWRKGDTEHIGM